MNILSKEEKLDRTKCLLADMGPMELKNDSIDGFYFYSPSTGQCTFNPVGKIYNSKPELISDFLRGNLEWGEF